MFEMQIRNYKNYYDNLKPLYKNLNTLLCCYTQNYYTWVRRLTYANYFKTQQSQNNNIINIKKKHNLMYHNIKKKNVNTNHKIQNKREYKN